MKGERRSKRKGQSVEFADFRNYVAGDDLRLLDWNLYARLDKLIIKLFLEEEDLHFYTLIDASMSMDFGDADEAASTPSNSPPPLGFIGLVRGDRVRIETHRPARQPARPRPARPRRASGGCSQHLDAIEPGENDVARRRA